jgi:Cu/Ag efflux pump CusA
MLTQSFLPTFKETNLLVRWKATPGTSRPEMSRIVSRATGELRKLPGVQSVAGHVGRAVLSDEVANVNSGEIWFRIDPTADYDAILATVRETVHGYPGFEFQVSSYLGEKTSKAQAANAEGLVVRVYGHEFDVLRETAEDVKKALSSVDGLAELRVEELIEEPQVEIKVKLDAAERYGIKPGDVRRAAATLVSGLEVGSLFEQQKVFGVVVWGVPEVRHSLSSIRDLLIDTPTGGHVRLGEVAEVTIKPTPTVIKREGVSRYMDVIATVRGRGLEPIFDDVEERLERLKFPQEYRAEIVSTSAERLEERTRMLEIGIAAAIGILLVLQVCAGSWLMAALTFVSLIAALSGGVLAALLGGGVLTIGSLIGLIGVFAIAARNCLSLISRYQHLERHEGETMGAGLVQRGTRDRFAPIVMTAATVALAFLPVALFGGVAGLEIVQPMAIVILGGLVTSTIVSLFVVPALYLKFGSSPEPEFEESAEGTVFDAAE